MDNSALQKLVKEFRKQMKKQYEDSEKSIKKIKKALTIAVQTLGK